MVTRLLLVGIFLTRVASAEPEINAESISHNGLVVWLKAEAGLKTDRHNGVTNWSNQAPGDQQNVSQLPVASQSQLSALKWNGNSVVHFDQPPPSAIDDIINSGSDYSLFIVRALAGSPRVGRGDENPTPDAAALSVRPFRGRHNSDEQTTVETDKPTLLTILKGPGIMKFSLDGEKVDQPDANMNDLTGKNASTAVFRGNVAEVLLYDRKLSNGEKLRVEIYLANKYGIYHPNATWPLSYPSDIQDQIEANNWNEDQAKGYLTFQDQHHAINPLGLTLWLEADKGVQTTDHGQVQAWQDQSPGGNDAYLPADLPPPVLEPHSLKDQPAIQFKGDTLLETHRVVTKGQDFSVFLVCTVGGESGPFYNGYSGGSGWGIAKERGSNTNSYSMVFGGRGFPVSGVIHHVTKPQLLSATRSQGSAQFYVFGQLCGTSSLSMADPTGIAYVGGIYTDQGYGGLIAEILVYDRALSDSDRKQVEDYLTDKYKLSASE